MMNQYLVCPTCGESLTLKIKPNGGSQYFECDNHHAYPIDDGVVYFNTKEIPGERWSLTYRNYEHYLLDATHPGLSRYNEGKVPYKTIMWDAIESLRPNTIVDFACGTGSGIKHMLSKINWPCTVILTDLSFRILSWNRQYYESAIANPFVDLVFLACDCSNVPLKIRCYDR